MTFPHSDFSGPVEQLADYLIDQWNKRVDSSTQAQGTRTAD